MLCDRGVTYTSRATHAHTNTDITTRVDVPCCTGEGELEVGVVSSQIIGVATSGRTIWPTISL